MIDIIEQISATTEETGGIVGKIVKFDFGTDGIVRVDCTSGVSIDDQDDTADCVITISTDDYRGWVDGSLNITQALINGTVVVTGDFRIAQQLGPIIG